MYLVILWRLVMWRYDDVFWMYSDCTVLILVFPQCTVNNNKLLMLVLIRCYMTHLVSLITPSHGHVLYMCWLWWCNECHPFLPNKLSPCGSLWQNCQGEATLVFPCPLSDWDQNLPLWSWLSRCLVKSSRSGRSCLTTKNALFWYPTVVLAGMHI